MNKKATMEWPTFLISTIFSMLLFIIGIFMIFNVAKLGNINPDVKLDVLNYGLLASRVLNSADCLAWEEKTPNGYLVHAGIIDSNKLSNINDCISGKKDYVAVEWLSHENNVRASVVVSSLGVISDPSGIMGSGFTFDGQPLDKSKWDYFAVKVFDGGKLHDGVALIAIK
ncbi:MAG: hypothetical protein AABX75_02005 [Nanoarchaeota archaeon]